MKKIIIGGDSWGCGEIGGTISPGVKRIPHLGIAQYFTESGHQVINCSKVGVSNSMSVAALTQAVYMNPDADYVFWFQTDPLRDLMPYETNFNGQFSTYQQLIDESRALANISYLTLNDLGRQIYCIGGCSKLYLDIIQDYQQLVPIVPSATKLVIPEYEHPELWQSGWIVNHERQFSIEELDRIIEDREKQLLLGTNLQSAFVKYFQPDGQHLNRLGHKILFTFLCKELNIDSNMRG